MTHLIPFMTAGDVTWSAQVRHLKTPGHPLHLRLTTRMAQTRDAQAERVLLELTLGEAEYRSLLRILLSALNEQAEQSS
ncbi:hypothetical protein [Ottowia sp.]|uniref:hypothetical protein n=1 Tax=Ottowia sp. TaxID=1898956 RepID=UPI0025F072AC|nr:hypothetical protein [Ottowia sp.]